MQAIILAGGMGTRLRSILGDIPKPMIPIGGKPLLEHQVELAKCHGFTDILILACYRADLIEKHFGDGSAWGVRISVIVEKQPLGTAGAVLAEFGRLAENFLVLYGDTMLNVDLRRIWNQHSISNADATLLLHPNDHPLDSDLVEADEAGWIGAFHNRPHPADTWFQNLVNAGLYVMRRDALKRWAKEFATSGLPLGKPSADFGKDLFPAMLRSGCRLLGYNTPEFIKDIGTPERYARISAQYEAGIVARSSLVVPQKAVFLDRDGTLIEDKDCLRNAEGLELLPGVASALHRLNQAGWRTVVVTNQPVIAKGWCTFSELRRIHKKMETLLGIEHAFLDRIYFCPHHPEKGFEGEIAELKIHCDCRKPETGMLQQASKDLNIDLSQSWMVGDSTVDVETARRAGVRSILVRTGNAGLDGRYHVTPDFIVDTLNEAVDVIET